MLIVWQLGLEKYLVFTILIVLLILGILYFAVLPSFGINKMAKNFSRLKKTIVFLVYYSLFTVFVIAIFFLPNYAMKIYNYDFASTPLFRFLLFLFLTLPLSFLFCMWIIYRNKNERTEEGVTQV